MVFQSYALYPHMTVRENMDFGMKINNFPPEDRKRRIAEAARILQLEALSRPQARPALGRPAPARRHRPGHRQAAQGLPVRRAAVEPRRQAAGADAGRARGAAPRARGDDDLRHPRPGRGDDDGRQDRRAERRADRAGGQRRWTSITVRAREFVAGFHRGAEHELPRRSTIRAGRSCDGGPVPLLAAPLEGAADGSASGPSTSWCSGRGQGDIDARRSTLRETLGGDAYLYVRTEPGQTAGGARRRRDPLDHGARIGLGLPPARLHLFGGGRADAGLGRGATR